MVLDILRKGYVRKIHLSNEYITKKQFFCAITGKAGDVHLEPFEKGFSSKKRIDCILQSVPVPAKKYYPAIVSEIKIMFDLDIAKIKLPQDGKCRVKVLNQTYRY